MKEFKLPSKLEDLENADSEFLTVSSMIDLESCDSDECSAMLSSVFHSSYSMHRYRERDCGFSLLRVDCGAAIL